MENMKQKQQRVYLLCGPAGSGKSTLAHKLMAPMTDVLLSRDNLRFAMLGENEDYFAHENEVRKRFLELIQEHTTSDEFNGIFIDATHLTVKARKQIQSAMKNNPYKIAISFEVPLKVALERNSKRNGLALVPESAIRNMYNCYKIPTLSEGFDEIWHIDAEGVIRKEVKE